MCRQQGNVRIFRLLDLELLTGVFPASFARNSLLRVGDCAKTRVSVYNDVFLSL